MKKHCTRSWMFWKSLKRKKSRWICCLPIMYTKKKEWSTRKWLSTRMCFHRKRFLAGMMWNISIWDSIFWCILLFTGQISWNYVSSGCRSIRSMWTIFMFTIHFRMCVRCITWMWIFIVITLEEKISLSMKRWWSVVWISRSLSQSAWLICMICARFLIKNCGPIWLIILQLWWRYLRFFWFVPKMQRIWKRNGSCGSIWRRITTELIGRSVTESLDRPWIFQADQEERFRLWRTL